MPPFSLSRHAHEEIDSVHFQAVESMSIVAHEQETHFEVDRTAINILYAYGQYETGRSIVCTPWVYDPDQEEGTTRTAYQLRASSAVPKETKFEEISLVVRISRPNPINPNALIAWEEIPVVLNSDVVFQAGDKTNGTLVRETGKGVALPQSEAAQKQTPVANALSSAHKNFINTVDTLALIQLALEGSSRSE